MRASSRQLKTPVAAAMLLIDGMIDEMGKYADVKTYLPQVKGKLIEMRDIVNNVLYLKLTIRKSLYCPSKGQWFLKKESGSVSLAPMEQERLLW